MASYRTYSEGNVTTKFLPEKPSRKELERLTITQLAIIAKRQPGIKKVLLDFLDGKKLK